MRHSTIVELCPALVEASVDATALREAVPSHSDFDSRHLRLSPLCSFHTP
jgi:hypothetical protein